MNYALIEAEKAHFNQTRWNGDPYINHPIEVVRILNDWGINNHIIINAAYLHDVLEDTDYTEEKIKEKFGDQVLIMVKELTFNLKGHQDEEYWGKCRNLSTPATYIKIADILANLGDDGKKSTHFIQKRTKALEILINNILETGE